ncbi:ecdysteroid 22-kinase family protein [Shewanella pneumatophori]|uniref:Ecdysteroid 22-kinase family protein n=1 Tax=Shewanella pneumatophori TaxID=314092 RepID=A0A9X1Z845_9GAMM|nr:ecdysteroid 22-kinase family protein [Shewanella pneumatophori]MCL1137274.1 ecdysteroid 22-kinase family protein [Shewanella pneumatophori]
MNKVDIDAIIGDLIGSGICRKSEVVQTLWSGYGEISRFSVGPKLSASPSSTQSFIVKTIVPPENIHHPRGWANEISHKRKLRSYEVETNFYRNWAQQCDDQCRVPKLLAEYGFSGAPQEQSRSNNIKMIIMSDLDADGFDNRADTLTVKQTKVVLGWLAHFHAKFIELDDTKARHDLWPIGSYWHLETRKQEFDAMPDSSLKLLAEKIDKLLNNCKYKTIIHGDAKVANFCFNADYTDVAAVDFQYVGSGIGVKDVIYLLGSCLTESQLVNSFDTLMNEYFQSLTLAIQLYHPDLNAKSIVDEWLDLVDIAWADFERFLVGWAPSHPKRNGFSQTITDRALAQIIDNNL